MTVATELNIHRNTAYYYLDIYIFWTFVIIIFIKLYHINSFYSIKIKIFDNKEFTHHDILRI